MEGYYHVTYHHPPNKTIYVMHNTSHAIRKIVQQVMLDYWALYLLGLALLRVKLLETCGLRSSGNLLLDLLLLRNDPTNDGSYKR
jgi:hypothetical protein